MDKKYRILLETIGLSEDYHQDLNRFDKLCDTIDRPEITRYTYVKDNKINPTTKLFGLGYNTTFFYEELAKNRESHVKHYNDLKDSDYRYLHALRKELENEIGKLHQIHIEKCSEIEVKLISLFYRFIADEFEEIFESNYYNFLKKFFQEALEQLYNQRPLCTFWIYYHHHQSTDYHIYFDELVFDQLSEEIYQLLSSNKDLKKRASFLALRYALVQETISDKLIDKEEYVSEKAFGQWQEKKLAQKISTPKGKHELVLGIASDRNISPKKAFTIANELCLEILGKKVYKNYNSYTSSVTRLNKKKNS